MTRLKQTPVISPVKEFYPSEYLEDSNKIAYSEDLTKGQMNYESDPSRKLVFFPLRHDKNAFNLILEGVVQSNGIIRSDQFLTDSFCFELTNPSDTEALDHLGDAVFLRYPWIIEDFEYKSLVKKDKLWIKCKHKSGQYTFKHPFTTHQKKIAGFPIHTDMPLTLTTKLGGYVNWENKTYGVSLTLLKMELPTQEEPER